MSFVAKVAALKEAYLTQVNRLPQVYLRYFYQLKAEDDVKALLNTRENARSEGLQTRKFKREIRKLNRANCGDQQCMNHVLDLAYGRRGKLRRELLEPYTTDPDNPLPDPLIKGNERSRPPVYTKELVTLLTNGISRTTRALNPKTCQTPLKMPDRTSPWATHNGKPNKRREANARRRYFAAECMKTLPPLGLGAQPTPSLLNLGVLDDVHKLVGTQPPPSLTRRERLKEGKEMPKPVDRYPSRWMRRRYQELLSRVPIMDGTLSVSVSPMAISANDRSVGRLGDLDDDALAWYTGT
ncbi:hypothetical protein BDZ89DRAFT_1164263 [Hymenopellis radicata]|nr:hypothetical protein BDZ89DRAFT_1164263 [Hymenopellis radicata]